MMDWSIKVRPVIRRGRRRWLAETPCYPDATGVWMALGFGDTPDEALFQAEKMRMDMVNRCAVNGVNDAE